MNRLVSLIKKNPALLSKYVAVGTALVDKALVPLNKFMAHLLIIQDLDPKSKPGDRFEQSLRDAIDGVEDPEDFEKDYDLSWLKKSFERTRKNMRELNLSQDKFKELTDLSRVSDTPPEPVRTEALSSIPSPFEVEGDAHIESLKNALKTLAKYAGDLEKPTETFTASRQNVAVGKNKRSKGTRVSRSNFKGSFKRRDS